MTCAKLYINKDFDLSLTIPPDAGFAHTDISELVFTLTLMPGGSETAVYKKSLSEITVVSDEDITVHGKKADINTAGFYKISIDMTDTSGGDRGITPCLKDAVSQKNVIEFKEQ